MVIVSVSETYDLSTKVNKMGIVGIHTPTGRLIDKLWPGLVMQCEKFRFVGCDVRLACASILPADPLQVGVEAGDIAPQDLFNPILYKAVSNDSMTSFLNLLQQIGGSSSVSTALNQGSLVDVNNATFKDNDVEISQFDMYYGLLSSPGWRKSMPQAGLEMTNLRPLVFQVVDQYGYNGSGNNTIPDNGGISSTSPFFDINQNITNAMGPASPSGVNIPIDKRFRGPAMAMPSIDTMCRAITNDAFAEPGNMVTQVQSNTGKVPPAYVGLIIMPPARLNVLYYRMSVTWYVEFTGMRPLTEFMGWKDLANTASISYGTDYPDQSASMASTTDMVDVNGTDIQKIMES
nr:MAG: capsid protein [Smacoviridae sp.]